MVAYRPHALRHHDLLRDWWQPPASRGSAPRPSRPHQIVRHDFETRPRRAEG